MKIEEIKNMMLELEKSSLRKIIIKQADFELHLEKDSIASTPQNVKTVVEHPKQETVEKKESETEIFVKSPIVGTFYASAAPDQAPFVKVGDSVTEETVVCIIEAMKVMNEVKADTKGTVVEILVNNADPVEYGTPLFRVE